MKLNRLETHDRLQHFKKNQSEIIVKGAEDCLKRNELSLALQEKSPYIYLFAHTRTADNGTTKRLLWQPRLSKPLAQSNSYLFRAQSKTDIIEICWLIPANELWGQYGKGKVTESDIVRWSIEQFKTNRAALERRSEDDLPDERAMMILDKVKEEHRQKKLMEKWVCKWN